MKIAQGKIPKCKNWDATKSDMMELLKIKVNSCSEYRDVIVSSESKTNEKLSERFTAIDNRVAALWTI